MQLCDYNQIKIENAVLEELRIKVQNIHHLLSKYRVDMFGEPIASQTLN